MENADFTAQLAQFSTLEQIEKMNTHLSSLVQAQEALNRMQTNMQAASLIGKQVKVQGNTMHVQEGKASPVSYSLAADSPKVTIQIRNESGSLIQAFEELNKAAGEYAVSQPGGADPLSRLPDGKYTVEIIAQDRAGQPVSTQTLIQGRVDGVEYQDNRPYFLIGGNKLAFDAVVSIQEQE
jgi:flagellar basal-body rod modification protein FlgD